MRGAWRKVKVEGHVDKVLAAAPAWAGRLMSKAFTREDGEADGTAEEDARLEEAAKPLPAGAKNYMTPAGFARLRDELRR